jgi:predicted O-methyltransferase YrrM
MNIESQLNAQEKEILRKATSELHAPVIIEIGTFKGGGSTLTFLEELYLKQSGRLYGIEASSDIFTEMKFNIMSVNPGYMDFFEPICGFSQNVLPNLLHKLGGKIDLAFLDGGNNPLEQIVEFQIIASAIPLGCKIFAHDANLRKGKWFRPYIQLLDNWDVQVHQVSEEGLLEAKKMRAEPSARSQKEADRFLFSKKFSPMETVGRILPSKLNKLLLNLLPVRLRRRIGEGRNL